MGLNRMARYNASIGELKVEAMMDVSEGLRSG